MIIFEFMEEFGSILFKYLLVTEEFIFLFCIIIVMKKIKIKETNKNKIFLYIGLIGIIIAVVSIFMSMFFYQGYSISNQYLSELGHPSATTRNIFNFGLMISSILIMPFFYYFFYKKNNFSKIIFLSSIISLIGLFGVGFFPLTIEFEHYIFAGIFFIFASVFLLLFLINQFLEKNYLKIENFTSFIAFFSTIIFIFFLQNPLMQKISVSFILIFIASIIIKKFVNYKEEKSIVLK